MKKQKIILMVYDNILYIKNKDNYEKIKLDNDVISDGRLNNYGGLIKSLKQSQYVKKSLIKVVDDYYVLVCFNNYTYYEKECLKEKLSSSGFNKVEFVFYKNFLKSGEYTYIIFNNDYYYILDKDNYYVLSKDIINCYELNNKEIICDLDTYNYFKSKALSCKLLAIDNVPKYILDNIY